MRFRNRELRVLVTTTILERGVTIPRSDVFVLDADAPLFDAASLEQMAGRAGRSKDDPNGRVYFCAPHSTRSQREAIRQIREMNALAAARGYIRPHAVRAGRHHRNKPVGSGRHHRQAVSGRARPVQPDEIARYLQVSSKSPSPDLQRRGTATAAHRRWAGEDAGGTCRQ